MGLGDQWHKIAVYFGIADDEEYDDETIAPQEELERSYRERPNVRKLESARRRSEYDDIFANDAPPPRRSSSSGAVVRPIDAQRPASPTAHVHLVLPRSFNDAQQVADKFKANVPVILNLQNAETDLAKRLIDFCSGLTYACDGGLQRIGDKIFLLTPRNVEVSAEERQRLIEKGFYNQF